MSKATRRSFTGQHLASESTGKTAQPVPVQDIIRTTVTVLTLVGAVLVTLYAYRKQLLDEGASHRADANRGNSGRHRWCSRPSLTVVSRWGLTDVEKPLIVR